MQQALRSSTEAINQQIRNLTKNTMSFIEAEVVSKLLPSIIKYYNLKNSTDLDINNLNKRAISRCIAEALFACIENDLEQYVIVVSDDAHEADANFGVRSASENSSEGYQDEREIQD